MAQALRACEREHQWTRQFFPEITNKLGVSWDVLMLSYTRSSTRSCSRTRLFSLAHKFTPSFSQSHALTHWSHCIDNCYIIASSKKCCWKWRNVRRKNHTMRPGVEDERDAGAVLWTKWTRNLPRTVSTTNYQECRTCW